MIIMSVSHICRDISLKMLPLQQATPEEKTRNKYGAKLIKYMGVSKLNSWCKKYNDIYMS